MLPRSTTPRRRASTSGRRWPRLRPQQRLQIRRMADASLALAERRAGDLKAATDRLGVEGPTSGQLFCLRVVGLVAPPSSAGIFARIRGIVIVLAAIVAILGLGFGIVEGDRPAGRRDLARPRDLLRLRARHSRARRVASYYGRRRQKAALAKRREEHRRPQRHADHGRATPRRCAGATHSPRRTRRRCVRASRSASHSPWSRTTTSRRVLTCSRSQPTARVSPAARACGGDWCRAGPKIELAFRMINARSETLVSEPPTESRSSASVA